MNIGTIHAFINTTNQYCFIIIQMQDKTFQYRSIKKTWNPMSVRLLFISTLFIC